MNPGGCEIFRTCPDQPWGTASYTMGTRSFPGVKQPGVELTTQPHLVLRLRKEYSYTSTLPLGRCGLF